MASTAEGAAAGGGGSGSRLPAWWLAFGLPAAAYWQVLYRRFTDRAVETAVQNGGSGSS